MPSNTDLLAEIITDYSTRVKAGDRVLIVCEGLEGMPLVKSLHKKCVLKRARHVEYVFREPSITRDFLCLADDSQLSYYPPEYLSIIQDADVYIWIGAPTNTRELALVEGSKSALHKKALAPLREERLKGTRWFALLYPTHGLAQDAGMSLEEFSEFFFQACLRDWAKEREKMLPLKEMLDRCRTITITGPDTELSLKTGGGKAVCCAGEVNLPDGEIFIGPDKHSAEGTILFNMPAFYQGRLFHDVRLTFEKGRVVRASSRNDEVELTKILDTDEGSRYLGEFAIGLNRQTDRQFFNVVFDEKIFATIHLALGHCYPQSDNGNQSAVHWDLIYSLKGGGKLLIDEVPIFIEDSFVHPHVQHLNAP